VPKKKQLDHALMSLKAHGSQPVKLSCNLSLSAFEEERRRQQQSAALGNDTVDNDEDDDDDDETLVCTVSSVSLRTCDGTGSSVLFSATSDRPYPGNENDKQPNRRENLSDQTESGEQTAAVPISSTFTFRGLKPVTHSQLQAEKDRIAAEALVGNVMRSLGAGGKQPLGTGTDGGKGAPAPLSFKEMLMKNSAAAAGEVRLSSLRTQHNV
jgi:hypothetical protein